MIKSFLYVFILNININLSQENSERFKIDLYPNPATEYINLKLTSDIEIEDLDFSIHSLIGNEMPITKENISDDEIRFNINNYNKGFYFLFISNQDSNNRKILKFSKN
tara:strand:- start:5213 stop:5536 length:324 start_codon:yes stop_codon:yes gene_type:complete